MGNTLATDLQAIKAMAAWHTENSWVRTGRAPSTEKHFRGRRYEKCALWYFRFRGYQLILRNDCSKIGEIDLLFRSGKGKFLLVEVRGRWQAHGAPRFYLSQAKRLRLLRLAAWVSRKYKGDVHVELVEIIGSVRSWTWLLTLLPGSSWIRRIPIESSASFFSWGAAGRQI